MDPRIEKYLEINIKDIINEFKGVQEELERFEIGCAPCGLGTCKLKDVVSIHNMNAENEKKLFDGIFAIIYPGESLVIPRIGQDKKNTSSHDSISPPMRLLIEEHKLIKRVLSLIPAIAAQLDTADAKQVQLVKIIADFIRSYADIYHHAKEENVLFSYFDATLDIIKVIVNDHVQSRKYVADMVSAAETGNTAISRKNLVNYSELLTEHINKEDTILYPWMDSNLNTRQVGEMFSKFMEINNANKGIQEKYEAIVGELEIEFLK